MSGCGTKNPCVIWTSSRHGHDVETLSIDFDTLLTVSGNLNASTSLTENPHSETGFTPLKHCFKRRRKPPRILRLHLARTRVRDPQKNLRGVKIGYVDVLSPLWEPPRTRESAR